MPLDVKIVETIQFEDGGKARDLERKLKNEENIRASSSDKFEGSDELFSCNPLEYAKQNGFVESSERKKRLTLFDYG